ncbi:asparagine synthase (glutamine-hydrolyzing) [Desulfogranum mediterraneum]|uniref:asparagine synthase (glutamine-hydrolyzing) n=1 Tax=Desulfogranum mediterraneum TaxID=160661 RepID=UPI0003F7B185|nr:asparagine synthase (glutamine-hydrolyzing) [Desulfogranum mediterraneum]
MCGIVGYSGFETDFYLEGMNSAQIHRGPDDHGKYWDPSSRVGMAMRRLSIVDLESGHQPMMNSSKNIVITFNGEIFNAPAIRKELQSKGIEFVTSNSDTEVILKLYETVGEDCVTHLNGMFAFVIYDRQRRVLFGARDPFGIKPLHVFRHSDGIAWASEIKSFFALPSFMGDVDSIAVSQYLGLQYVPGAKTIYKDVEKIEMGWQFTYHLENGHFKHRKYYNLPLSSTSLDTELDSSCIRDRFYEAVVRWSLSDVPIACSLSGGVDSAAIVACLARSGINVKTYTLGFRSPFDSAIDETSYAREVADMYSTDHHEVFLDVDDLLLEIPSMVQHLDEPYGGGLPSWYVFKYMAQDVKVALTGTGGDELFSNYHKYRWLESRACFSSALFLRTHYPQVSRGLSRLSRCLTEVKKAMGASGEALPTREVHRREDAALFWSDPFGLTFPTGHGTGFSERVCAEPNDYRKLSLGRQALQDIFDKYKGESVRNRCVAVDFSGQLPNEFLFMTDRFSMAHSIEARTPFLDKEMVALMLGTDPYKRLNVDLPKQMLKKAFQNWLPDGFTERRKQGFVLPVARWLRGPLKEEAMDLFSPQHLAKSGYVRKDFQDTIYRKFLEGETGLTETVWTVYMFLQWQKHSKYGS